jgi:betaine-aldehyde dehydrogenase
MTTLAERKLAPDQPWKMLIAGEFVEAADGARLTATNPATEEVVATFPDAGEKDVEQAVVGAQAAAQEWARQPWTRRAEILRDFAQAIADHADEFGRLDTLDSGNPLDAMVLEARSVPSAIEFYAGLASEIKGFTAPQLPTRVTFTERSPYGVVGRIVAFNHPFTFAAGKVAAPLVAGNAIIIKPAEQTSLSALEMGRIAAEVLPKGLVSVITGRGGGAGQHLVAHPGVPRIAFIGSVPTGRAILRTAAEHIKHVSLELGGKNPLVIFDDVDPRQAATAAISAMNIRKCAGQSCGSASRVYVHAAIHDAFVESLAGQLGQLVIGDPLQPSTDIGPLAFREHYERVLNYIELGKSEGARLVCGGGRPPGFERGFYVAPTVFADVTDEMRIGREEIFGPVISVFSWTDPADVLRRANDTDFGLTANVWTRDISVAHRMARDFEAGYVYVNGSGGRPLGTPFGGWKHSGLGKDDSLEELLSYTREKTVSITL